MGEVELDLLLVNCCCPSTCLKRFSLRRSKDGVNCVSRVSIRFESSLVGLREISALLCWWTIVTPKSTPITPESSLAVSRLRLLQRKLSVLVQFCTLRPHWPVILCCNPVYIRHDLLDGATSTKISPFTHKANFTDFIISQTYTRHAWRQRITGYNALLNLIAPQTCTF